MRPSQAWVQSFFLAVSFAIGPALMSADHPMIDEPAPMFDLQSLDGGQLRSGDLRGRFVVLHFGAGW